MWKHIEERDIQKVVASAERELIICSPFLSRHGLALLAKAIAANTKVSRVELWTRLSERDWLLGTSDIEALADFIGGLPEHVEAVVLAADTLHAKFVLSDGGMAVAGSANLTRAGLRRNIELGRVVAGPEVGEIQKFVDANRENLQHASTSDIQDFLTRVQSRNEDREALIDLLREVEAEVTKRLTPLREFIRFTKAHGGWIAREISVIFHNTDGNNRTGHLKQAYYGVQRFLQAYPQHLQFASMLPADQAFDLRGTQVERDWLKFLREHHEEEDQTLGYDLSILADTYLTPDFGGNRTGGGGGDFPFKLVWPMIGRMLAREEM